MFYFGEKNLYSRGVKFVFYLHVIVESFGFVFIVFIYDLFAA